jgi:hypothetical protein
MLTFKGDSIVVEERGRKVTIPTDCDVEVRARKRGNRRVRVFTRLCGFFWCWKPAGQDVRHGDLMTDGEFLVDYEVLSAEPVQLPTQSILVGDE